MARGFYTTDGVDTTDVVTTGYTTHPTAVSVGIVAYRTGAGGNNLGRLFVKPSTAAGLTMYESVVATSTYTFEAGHSTTSGQWSITAPSSSVWNTILVLYDGSSPSNNPLIYVNGSSVTVTSVVTPVGTLSSSSNPWTIGNSGDGDRGWNGRLAEVAVWDRILTADEAAAHGKGFAPSMFPRGLVLYYPLDGRTSPERDFGMGSGSSGTLTGTAYQAHPRIIYPQGFYLGGPSRTITPRPLVTTMSALRW